MGFFIEIYPDGRNIHEEAEGENGARTRPESRNKKNYAGAGHESDRIVSPRKSGMGSVSPAFPVHSFATGFIRYGIKRLIHPSTSSTCAGSDPVSSKNRLRLSATRERERIKGFVLLFFFGFDMNSRTHSFPALSPIVMRRLPPR